MFQHYCLLQSQSHPTFSLWMLYIEMVQLLLLFIRATRESDWLLHLSTIRSMLPWFFVTDRFHYSRYANVYWTEMSCLQNTHPGALKDIINNWTCQRQDRYRFSAIAADQTMEQTFNRNSKTSGGIIGFTLDRSNVQRWIMAQSERLDP